MYIQSVYIVYTCIYSCDVCVTCPLLCCLDVTACEPLHHQHIPVAHMAQVPVEGGPWFFGVGHHTVALGHSLGGKHLVAADSIW